MVSARGRPRQWSAPRSQQALVDSADLEFLGFGQLIKKVDFSQEQPATGYTNKVELGYPPLGGVAHELVTFFAHAW
ncbi:hypothetical protein RSOL_247530, partial [Rhizoctonia solani AG-3 Rhs1AP]